MREAHLNSKRVRNKPVAISDLDARKRASKAFATQRGSLFSSSSSGSDSAMTVQIQKEKKDQQQKTDTTRSSSSSKMHAIQRVFGRKSRKNTSSMTTDSSRRHTLPNKYPDISRSSANDERFDHESLLAAGRRGLFEIDDENDSLEALRVKAKERHVQKRVELEKLKKELGDAFKSIQQLEMRLASSEKTNAEAQTGLKDCQKTVEKRNRQLIKASEKIEALIKERDTTIAVMEKKTEDVIQNAKKEVKCLEDEFSRQLMKREDWHSKLVQSTRIYDEKINSLRMQITNLKQQRKKKVLNMNSREKKEYQDLLLRCERAEALNTQYNHQLEESQKMIEIMETKLDSIYKQDTTDFDQNLEVKLPRCTHPRDPEQRSVNNENHIASNESGFDDQQKNIHEDTYRRHPSKGSSINFFDKISFRFKKNVSPQNSTHKTFRNATSFETSSSNLPSARSEFEHPASRPKLHIPLSTMSKEDESSDSMFGSDSDDRLSSHSLSGARDCATEDQEAPPSPPPPPPPPTDEQRHLFEKIKPRAESSLSSSPSLNGVHASHISKVSRGVSSSDESNDQDRSPNPEDILKSRSKSAILSKDSKVSENSNSSSDEDEGAESVQDSRRDSPHGKRAKSRMNKYMEKRARKHQENIRKEEEKVTAESRQKEEYDKEWEQLAQEERERKKKQQQRRTSRRRPASMKSTRFSQVKQQFQAQHQHSTYFKPFGQREANVQDEDTRRNRNTFNHNFENASAVTAAEDAISGSFDAAQSSGIDTELHIRQQARLRERHEMELLKKKEAQEADAIRGDTHRRVEKWAYGKGLIQLILTIDQVSSLESLRENQIMVAHSPENNTLKKAYRNIIRIIHPDKLRDVSIAQQVEAQELFMVLNQAFESHKAQLQDT
ncbi:unnamed protein product [Albugo candida]|uniref:J domain-containing protein n=1 Tax=Albugo candida TaxID=65357 RepID=A0A024FYN6_9STRA|nr:unnamed protein product [Albugo candida]|eukprot:CCI39626.1 unnamed protein product [Albugo candida]